RRSLRARPATVWRVLSVDAEYVARRRPGRNRGAAGWGPQPSAVRVLPAVVDPSRTPSATGVAALVGLSRTPSGTLRRRRGTPEPRRACSASSVRAGRQAPPASPRWWV